ncbi:MAG: TonB-dependent receptor plug domain-containing protein [Winogradskyella sp.]|uniref:TonB-dependent receptor plug domain-containing protein n=1 Tax=Winogradskyella sp. TaxID=1883156 RepID=UPI00385945E6
MTCLHLNSQENQKVPLSEVLSKIETLHRITFNYKSGLIDTIEVFPLQNKLSLPEKVKKLNEQTNLIFKKVSDAIITISKPITICGYLIDEFSEKPLQDATINGTLDYAISDQNGYFEIKLNSEEELVTIRHLGFIPINREAKLFNKEECASIIMFVQQEMINPVMLQTYLIKGIDKKQDWSTAIDYSRFSLLPGLTESDVLQTVQALPSILSVDETVSNINIRGGSNDQNLFLWDDIKMYQTGHFFGLISSFNPSMTQTASVINNGSDVSYTDGTSGTIHMKTNEHINSEFEGMFGLNFLNAELFIDTPIGDKSSLQLASRKSIDDLLRTPTYNVYFDRITQDTEIQNNVSDVTNSNQEFNFYDTSLRWLYNPSDKNFFRLNFMLTNNNLSFNESLNTNSFERNRESSVSQNSIVAGLSYIRQWDKKFSSTLNITNSDYKLEAENADIIAEQLFLQRNSVSETNLKFENRYVKELLQFKLGYNFTETEIVNLNDIDLPRFVRRDEEVLREHALFGQAWYSTPSQDFSFRGGIRANYITEFNELIIEPRVSVRKAIGNHIEIEALGEFKHQSTSQIVNFQNDFLGIEKRRWQLTDNDSIPIIRSKQASIGILYNKKGWLADAKAYYKNVDGITTQSQSFTTKYETARTQGSYDAYGVEFLLRKKLEKLSTWFSYSFIKNIYTFQDLEEVEFASNFDITHSVTIGSTFSNKNWDISAGLNYRKGKPTSIPLADNEIIKEDINFDIANNERLLDYMRVDASAMYKFKINNTFRSEIGASVWNIMDRRNVINNYYRITDDTINQFSRYSLGLTSNVVFKIYF